MNKTGKNYRTDGGATTVIGGKLVFAEGAGLSGFPGAENLVPSDSTDAASVRQDVNELIMKLKNAGLMVPDEWGLSVLACPTPAAMPTAETAENSGHSTVSIDGTLITVTLDCKVSDLADANHGETWGEHKWLGFGVSTGLDSLAGIRFTDDTGATAELTEADEDEAEALGLSAGEFVLYIKAEDEAYLAGEKGFALWADGYAETVYRMQIVEG